MRRNLTKFDHPYLCFADERLSKVRQVTFSELHKQVARYSEVLKNFGVQKGDRVCGYVANTEHAVIACLATASLGAIWSSTSPDLGYSAVVGRFQQIRPKVANVSEVWRSLR